MPTTNTIRAITVAVGTFASTVAGLPVLAQEAPPLIYGVQIEQLEYRFGDATDVMAWDGDAVIGRDEVKFRVQSEGEYARRSDSFETLENQLLVQAPISDFFDAKVGVRFDTPSGPDRTYGVIGIQGLAQQWFEIDADLFLSENGDGSARLDAEYELLITNRIILVPSTEINVAFSDDREIGIGAGLSSAELGLRVSYDLIDRAVAPYAGVFYERSFGETANLARAEGEDRDALFFVVGTRLLF